jgi:hypothetical protein
MDTATIRSIVNASAQEALDESRLTEPAPPTWHPNAVEVFSALMYEANRPMDHAEWAMLGEPQKDKTRARALEILERVPADAVITAEQSEELAVRIAEKAIVKCENAGVLAMVRRVEIREGEYLIVEAPGPIDEHMAGVIRKSVDEHMPGVRTLVFSGGLRVGGVVLKDEPDERDGVSSGYPAPPVA